MFIKTVIELKNRPLDEFPIEKQLEEIRDMCLKFGGENYLSCDAMKIENGLVTVFNFYGDNQFKTEAELKDEQLGLIAELSPMLPDGTYFWTKTSDSDESVLLSDNYNPLTNQNE